jgi:hypothetical protein
MPITLSDKRKAAIEAAIHRVITDLRLEMIRDKHYDIRDQADVVVGRVETTLYEAVIAAAEGRDK